MNSKITFVLWLTCFWLGLFYQTVQAQRFECAFISDKYSEGKSNTASCSGYPDQVLSTKDNSLKPNQHCSVSKPYDYIDLNNIQIDLERKTISWEQHYGLIDSAKATQKAYYIKEKNLSESEAEKDAAFVDKSNEYFKIINIYKGINKISYDPVFRKTYSPPKETDEYHILFKNNYKTHHLYIPLSSGESILTENTGNEDHSWINIRFGRCRLLK